MLVVGFFALLGLEDGSVMVLHFIILFAIAALQIRSRSLAGWWLLFTGSAVYGCVVLASPDLHNIGE